LVLTERPLTIESVPRKGGGDASQFYSMLGGEDVMPVQPNHSLKKIIREYFI